MPHPTIRYLFWSLLVTLSSSLSSTSPNTKIGVYKIEGNIVFPPNDNALHNTRILVNDGEFVGIPRVDGSFVIAGVPSGSYVVSIDSPRHIFESVRVDITKGGKIRARKVNLMDPRVVILMRYPLHFETCTVPNYFEKREAFSLIDFLQSQMFLSFIALIVPFTLLTRLMPQGQEMQEAAGQANDAMRQFNNIFQPQMNMPDLTDICIRFFGGVRRERRAHQ